MARRSYPLPAMCLVSDPKTLALSREAAFSCKAIQVLLEGGRLPSERLTG